MPTSRAEPRLRYATREPCSPAFRSGRDARMTQLHQPGKLPPHNPIADDGDELHFCSTCAFGSVCLPAGLNKSALTDLHMLVEHVGPFHTGDHVFRSGERFGALYAVRAGMVKTRQVD